MKPAVPVLVVLALVSSPAFAKLPAGLKCDPHIKIVGADIGEVGKYAVQKGMVKEEHSALVNRKKVVAVDGCHYPEIQPGQVVVVRYSGPEVAEPEVQCIDRNDNDAPVTFPKSIYTVRNSHISPWMLMPLCPDGSSKDGFPCSKLLTQSERATEYKNVVLKWKANDPKTKLFMIDLAFDKPFRNSVPAGAKLFCALVNKDGTVVVAGTAQYEGDKKETKKEEKDE